MHICSTSMDGLCSMCNLHLSPSPMQEYRPTGEVFRITSTEAANICCQAVDFQRGTIHLFAYVTPITTLYVLPNICVLRMDPSYLPSQICTYTDLRTVQWSLDKPTS